MAETLHAHEGAVRRSLVFDLDKIELRKSGDGKDYTITGHAAVFDSWSEDLYTSAGIFKERIAPGAFRSVLSTNPDVRLLFNHEGMPLARTKSRTLELSEDEAGLRVWAKVAPVGTGEQLRTAMERGDVDQMSFAFTVADDEWNDDGEPIERTITQVGELYDVSPVTYPAYPDTDAAVRELRAAVEAGRVEFPDSRQEDPVTEEDAAQPETDAAGTVESHGEVTADEVRAAEALPPVDGDSDSSAPAETETDPVVGDAEALASLRQASREAAQKEREQYLRLLKELAS